jgi:hypothetical protein
MSRDKARHEMLFVYRTGTILSAIVITVNYRLINILEKQCLSHVPLSLISKTSTFYAQNMFTGVA